MKYVIIVFLVFICIFTGCTNKNSPFGSPEANIIFNEIELSGSMIESIYTYRDSVESYMQTRNFASRNIRILLDYNHKIVLGNYEGIDIRALVRFDNVNVDTMFVSDAELSLFVHHIEHLGLQDFSIKIAPLSKQFDNYATWEKYGEAGVDFWEQVGGDFQLEEALSYTFSTIDSTGSDIDSITFGIDKDILKGWLSDNSTNSFGLILIADEVNEGFIEFYSRNNGVASLQPQLKVFLEEEDKSIHASFSVYIHDYSEDGGSEYLRDGIYLSNIMPRSFFLELSSLDSLYTLFPEISSARELKRINILQANLVLSINHDNTMMTNQQISVVPAIPDTTIYLTHPQDRFDYTKWYFYERITVSYKDEDTTMSIKITDPMRALISGIRDNRGIGFVNLQRNMDFSHINFYGMNAEGSRKPKIVIKYSYINE